MKIYQCICIIFIYLYSTSIASTQKHENAKTETSVLSQYKIEETSLRVMTFNAWFSGSQVDDGPQKIAKHILAVKPNIVAMQEIERDSAMKTLSKLGSQWRQCSNPSYSTRIFTTLTIVKEYASINDPYAAGCQLHLSNGLEVNVWSVHLDYSSYGPYAACNMHGQTAVVPEDLYSAEKGRMTDITTLHNHQPFKNNLMEKDTVPLLLVGDFNSPSHLDWTDATNLCHCGWSFEYPTTKYTEQQLGLVDSYRMVNPSPILQPGFTWSPVVFQGKEPQDRIDFIFYSQSACPGNATNENRTCLEPYKSVVYHGNGTIKPEPYQADNDWPSDHNAVITDFWLRKN